MTELSETQQRLRDLAAEHDAVILAHNYQRPEVQDAADLVGDSLELARKAAATDAAVILFCGVHFMAETAKILSPAKTVLMPDTHAGCPMADMVTVEGLRALKAQHPEAAVVAYVNTSAEIKAEVDVCCTSANAPEVVGRIPAEQPIIFVPDRNLGDWVAGRTGRTNMIMWDGWCPVHEEMTATEVRAALEANPGAELMAHPECNREVRALASVITSTSGMLRYPAGSAARTFVVATETGLLHRLRALYPDRAFAPAARGAVCPNMKRTTLDKAIAALDEGLNEIVVPPRIAERALAAVQRMMG
ncbi:MAG TPA: quinolinate synthase NadA [Thermoleophilia bacterium]|nr:quinolinate synthase NadA [Thermoleophilia bacterium]